MTENLQARHTQSHQTLIVRYCLKEIVNMTEQAGCQADLIFTGHAHGGLFRFPFVKGLYAPGQGFFPEYTSGKYELDGSEMIVSRGVGNSGYTRRFGDNFHLISVTLGR